MAAGRLVASCGNKSEAPVAEAEQAEQVVEETIPEEQPASLADIVANAKEAGAKWTTDEWKDAFKQRIELLPDGLVAIEVVWNDPDNPNLKLRPIGATWTIPYETAKGFAYAVNDAEEKFPDGPAKKAGACISQ